MEPKADIRTTASKLVVELLLEEDHVLTSKLAEDLQYLRSSQYGIEAGMKVGEVLRPAENSIAVCVDFLCTDAQSQKAREGSRSNRKSKTDLIRHPGYLFRDWPIVDLLCPCLKVFRLRRGEYVFQHKEAVHIEGKALLIRYACCHGLCGLYRMDGLF